MGVVEINEEKKWLTLHATFHSYGEPADSELSNQIAGDISDQWNAPRASIFFKENWYDVFFNIQGLYRPDLTREEVVTNTDPINNYFRIVTFTPGNISFTDGIGSNTGIFLLENLLHHSTTAAHEFGHTLGLTHPHDLDIRGRGTPGIMYPRGTLVDPEFQYDPSVPAGMKGGTLNPFKRKVLIKDIDSLQISRLDFHNGIAVVGGFSSVWHDEDGY